MPCLALLCHTLFGSTLLCIALYSLSCTALLCPALPCPALPCPALPCPALPCPALPCSALPCMICATCLNVVCHGKQSHRQARSILLQLPPSHLSLLMPFAAEANIAAASITHHWPHTLHAPHTPCQAIQAYCDMLFTAAMGLAYCESEHSYHIHKSSAALL